MLQLWLALTAAGILTVSILKMLYKVEKALKGPPPNEGRNEPAPEWSAQQYAVQVVAQLTGAGEPIPSHDALKVYLLTWLAFATLIACT